MKLYVRFCHELTIWLDKILKRYRKSRLNNTDFTIICNNCWGGYVYRRYGLPYNTPTIGLYFFAEDFCKFCENLRYYIEQPLCFISYKESKYKDLIVTRKQENVPIGKLGDIEIVFLHYKSEEEAREKWTRRASRINYNNLIFKFSYMKQCSEEELKRFDALEADKKICFVPTKRNDIKSAIFFKSFKNQAQITDDTSEYQRYVSIRKLINSRRTCVNNFES